MMIVVRIISDIIIFSGIVSDSPSSWIAFQRISSLVVIIRVCSPCEVRTRAHPCHAMGHVVLISYIQGAPHRLHAGGPQRGSPFGQFMSLFQDVFSSVRLTALRPGHGLPSLRLLSVSLYVVPSSQRPLLYSTISCPKIPAYDNMTRVLLKIIRNSLVMKVL